MNEMTVFKFDSQRLVIQRQSMGSQRQSMGNQRLVSQRQSTFGSQW